MDQDLLKNAQSALLAGDPMIIGVLIAILVVFLTIFILLCRGGSNKRRGILLVGLCDAGKTLLYSRLVDNRYVQTHTSVKENAGTYMLKGDKKKGTLRIIDLPGHDRLRWQYVEQYKNLARAYIFVVDSLSIQKEVRDAAEFLYTLLTDKSVQQNSPPVLVVCNKHDQTLAKAAKVIQALFEKEINTLRVTQSAALETTSATSNNNAFLGRRDKDFQFQHLSIRVDFVEASARGKPDGSEHNIKPIEHWLAQIA